MIILGAKGRFCRASVAAFINQGWRVRALARQWDGADRPDGSDRVERISVDAFDGDAVADAAMGCDVIVNALNPPYPRWRRGKPARR